MATYTVTVEDVSEKEAEKINAVLLKTLAKWFKKGHKIDVTRSK